MSTGGEDCPWGDAFAGALEGRGAGALGRLVGRGGGRELGAPGGGSVERSSRLPVMVPGFCLLYSRQHAGQRHSTMRSPVAVLARVSRQPNCALMSV